MAHQRGVQGNEHPNLTFLPPSHLLPVTPIFQIQLEAKQQGNL